MADSPLTKRLGIKPKQRVLVLEAPEGYWEQLGELPDDVDLKTSADGQFDVVQAFVQSKADVERLGPTALEALKPGGVLWFTYPKKSSKIKTDVTRDTGWDVVWNAGMEGVASIAVDETWSAVRFRPSADVKRQDRD